MKKSEIQTLLSPIVNDMGYDLWGCAYLSQGRHSLLRVYIDNEQGITLDDCEQVSRQISAYLDVEEPITGNYTLEVSSPGIPRPLFTLEQYKRYLGEPVKIKLFKAVKIGTNQKSTITGVITSIADDLIVLTIDGNDYGFAFSQINHAHLISE